MKRLLLTAGALFSLFSSSWGMTAQEENLLVRQTLSMFGGSSEGLIDTTHPPARACGTPNIMQAKHRFNELSSASQALLRPVLASRPSLPSFFDVPLLTGQTGPGFRIHYATSGTDSVRNASVDLRGFGSGLPNGVPDWVDTVGLVLDSIWIREVGQLGFRSPESDAFYPAGDGPRFDVYLQNLGPLFLGATYPDSAGGVLQNRSTAFIVLHSTFNVSPYSGQPNGPQRAMRVTAAHEFFHAVQFAYNAFGSEVVGGNVYPYWYEVTAVWMEEQVYNDINDYIQYLPFWFRSPELSFRTFSFAFGFDPDRAYHPYAMGIYGLYLSKRFPSPPYGYSVVRRIWENMATVPGFNLFSAIDNALAPVSSSFRASLKEFYQWNYFVGRKTPISPPDTLYGSESAVWPTFDRPSGGDQSHIDSTDVYPTLFPEFTVPCQSCPRQSAAFFCGPCTVSGPGSYPCSTKCPPYCRFVPYQPTSSVVCLNDVEDLGASYLTLQNVNRKSTFAFDLLGDPTRNNSINRAPTTWFAAAAGFDSTSRTRDFLTSDVSNSSGRIPELFFDEIGNYNEVAVMVMNDTLLPPDSSRKSSTYAYSATDSSVPPGTTRILDPRPNPFRPGRDGTIRFAVDLDSLPGSGDWEISLIVFNSAGEIVYSEEKKFLRGKASYDQRLYWNGKRNNLSQGEPVASGVYFCKIRMDEVGGRSRRVEKILKIALIR